MPGKTGSQTHLRCIKGKKNRSEGLSSIRSAFRVAHLSYLQVGSEFGAVE